MLDDVMKVEKGRLAESTEKVKTIALLEECKAAVSTVLPVSLELMVAASRGKIVLKKIQEVCLWLPSLKWPTWLSLEPCGSVFHEANKAAEMLVKQSVSHLEEMRVLVAKAEALVVEAKASAQASGTGLQLPPTPECPVLTLPGESVNLSEVAAPQS
jgi:hypothetical protein